MRVIAVALAVMLLSGCSFVQRQFTPVPPKVTPFLEHAAEMKSDPELPFALVWLAEPASQIRQLLLQNPEVMIAPVNLDYLGQGEPESWKKGLLSSPDVEDAARIAQELRQHLIDAIKSSHIKLQLVEQAGPQTLIIEPALVELRPTQPLLNAAQAVVGFFLPGSQLVSTATSVGIGVAVSKISKGSIGVQWRVKSQSSVLGEIADRCEDLSTLLPNLNDYSHYGYAHGTMSLWSNEMIQLFTAPQSAQLGPRSNFTFALW